MLRFLLPIIFASTVLLAQPFKVHDTIAPFSLANQFDVKKSVGKNLKLLLVSFEKSTGAEVNQFLSKQPAGFLTQHQAAFIANISGMPMIITKMFALPKMRGYPHQILLIYDENDTRFMQKEGKTTLYKLNNGVIQDITFITKEQLPQVFN